jgi:cobalt/nickel transport system permease protein
MWAASAGTVAFCAARVRREPDENRVPLMGVLGAFVFAAQMINFTIPGTGSSGHLGGGLLLAILLGPEAAFLVIASVLAVQALFFADGGLLAIGCNTFNLGFFPAFVAYPLVYRPLSHGSPGRRRLAFAVMAAAVAGLALGAGAVVLETVLSGISALPVAPFLLLMLPIHLAIGCVEGAVTLVLVGFIAKTRPALLGTPAMALSEQRSVGRLTAGILAAALLIGGALSWYASQRPDGLEWAIRGVTGAPELAAPQGRVHRGLAALQQRLAPFPDYTFRPPTSTGGAETRPRANRTGTSVAGVVGGLVTLAVAGMVGWLLRRRGAGRRAP